MCAKLSHAKALRFLALPLVKDLAIGIKESNLSDPFQIEFRQTQKDDAAKYVFNSCPQLEVVWFGPRDRVEMIRGADGCVDEIVWSNETRLMIFDEIWDL